MLTQRCNALFLLFVQALDAENMEGFIQILDMIKSQFRTVLLISHLDSLKDVVDQQILIEKNAGRAYVNE